LRTERCVIDGTSILTLPVGKLVSVSLSHRQAQSHLGPLFLMSVTIRLFGLSVDVYHAVVRDGWRAHETDVWASPHLTLDPSLQFEVLADAAAFANILESEIAPVEVDPEEVSTGLIPAPLLAARYARLGRIEYDTLRENGALRDYHEQVWESTGTGEKAEARRRLAFDNLKQAIGVWVAGARAMLVMTVP
jgi:hypothetical protein